MLLVQVKPPGMPWETRVEPHTPQHAYSAAKKIHEKEGIATQVFDTERNTYLIRYETSRRDQHVVLADRETPTGLRALADRQEHTGNAKLAQATRTKARYIERKKKGE